MPNRRKGAPGSFGAPLEKIVASFPAEVGEQPDSSEVKDRPAGLSPEDVGQSIRTAFNLNDGPHKGEDR